MFVVKKLQDDVEYKVTEGMNFPVGNNWAETIEALYKSQAELLKALELFDAGRLHDTVKHSSHNYSFYTLLHGIIHHDLYHAGQIALIRKQSF